MKYLFVVLGLMVCLGSCASPEPVATCTVPHINLKQLPISLNEIQSFNMNNFFTGFNIDLNLSSSAPDFAYLTGKTQKVKTFEKSQVGLKSYHFEHKGNRWGNTLMTLTEENHVSKIRWGVTSNNGTETIPELTQEVTIESQKQIDCYDAIWARHAHIAIVDCTIKGTFRKQNFFYFINTTSQVILPTSMETDMFAPFTQITRRRFTTFEKDGYDYLIRSYYADGVDDIHDHNTYFEIFTFNDPLKPRLLKIVDRSFLGQDRLSIMDIKPYMGFIMMLDFHSGLTIFDITAAQHVVVDYRYRTDSGFHRFAPFFNALRNEYIVAFANTHAIYQIDFTERLQPRIIAKYNLMQDSYVIQLWVSEDYVVSQVYANVTTVAGEQTIPYNSTIVFNRGTRTYLNAYDMFQHHAPNVIIDLERDRNLLMVMDIQRVNLYKLNTPILSINPRSQELLNKTVEFSVNGLSVNEASGHSSFCSFKFTFRVVDINSMIIYETGMNIPETYYANYPGQLYIPLDRYLIGANITYGVNETTKGSYSSHWILQQNQTLIHWQTEPSLFKYTFLRQQQYDNAGQRDIFIYTQDAAKNTHFAKCRTWQGQPNVTCEDNSFVEHVNEKIVNLTANRFHYYDGKYAHLAAIVYEDAPNQVFIYDVDAGAQEQHIKPIMFPDSYQGKISSIEFLGQFLAVVLRYTKEIVFYDMNQCLDHQEKICQEIYRIDSIMMDEIGVDYFSPLEVMASDFHPSVLFIQSIDRVIIVSFNFLGPHLLAQVKSPASSVPGIYHWKMAISRDSLVLVNPPSTIQEHRLKELYTLKDARQQRTYPIYNYMIPDSFDLDFSDAGDLIYITAQDTKLPEESNSVILVYHAGIPSVSAFYDVFHLNMKYSDLLIDATGNFQDYVSVAMGSILMMFRQYQIPVIVFEDNTDDFDFNITYTNDPQNQYKYLMKSGVKIANFPEGIKVNQTILNNSNFLNDMVDYYITENQTINLDDSDWFTGNVVNYTVEGCDQCGEKIKVINHLEDARDIVAETDMDDYVFTHDGGIVQQFQSMLQLRHNGSISQYIAMPAVLDGQNCRHVTHNWLYEFVVSACIHNEEEVYLYLTTLNSFKPFVNGPFYSSASSVASIQMQGDILMVVDVDENPSIMARQGGVIIYSLNHDINDREIFDELEYFDTEDLVAAQGWTYGDSVLIGNAHLMYTNITDLYRLAITELRNGVFFVDFRWKKGMRSVEIINIQFIDIKEELVRHHMPMPNMAFFEAISVINEFYNSAFRYWEIDFVITTRNFHMFQLNCFFDRAGKLVRNDDDIVKVFYRYGFYETSNYVKAFDGYIAVVQKVPYIYQDFLFYSKQVLTVYDSHDRFDWESDGKSEDEGLPGVYMLGGMTLPQGRVTFDYNFTFTRNRSDPFRDIGLIVLHSRQAKIRELRIHDNVSISLEQGIRSDQKAEFVAQNDFTKFRIPLDVIVHGLIPGWAIGLIIVGSLVVAGGLGYIVYIMFVKKKESKEQEIKKSLLEESAADELSASSQSESDDEEDSEESGQDSAEQEKAKSPPKVQSQQPNPDSINRESIEKKEEKMEQDKDDGQEEAEQLESPAGSGNEEKKDESQQA